MHFRSFITKVTTAVDHRPFPLHIDTRSVLETRQYTGLFVARYHRFVYHSVKLHFFVSPQHVLWWSIQVVTPLYIGSRYHPGSTPRALLPFLFYSFHVSEQYRRFLTLMLYVLDIPILKCCKYFLTSALWTVTGQISEGAKNFLTFYSDQAG